MDRRVVVTGLGPVSSIGTGIHAFGSALRTGQSRISPISSFDTTGFPHIMAGEVSDFFPETIVRALDPHQWGRASQFAAAAARLAVQDAQLDPAALPPGRSGSVFGTTSGESQTLQQLTEQWVATGLDTLAPEQVGQAPSSRLAAAANHELGLHGEAVTVSAACAASNYAIGYAYDLLAAGDLDFVIAGGAECTVRWPHAGFHRLGALAEDVCSPFDRDRTGTLPGEGGSALLLETLESAQTRNARIYAEILGYGLSCDARHPVAPDSEGIAACMRRAHHNAGVKAADVDYICAHGTGTPANDAAEAAAVHSVFGDAPPPMSSIKSMLGHTMGASSGFGAIACALGLKEGFMPPTINFRTPDPDIPGIDPVPNHARPAPLRVAQNNGFGFGGNNAITLFGVVD